MWVKTIGLILFLCCLTSLAEATNYYVNASTGSNTTGDGTSGNPWQTITHALSQISGTSHTVYVAAGTYDTALGETFPIVMKDGVSLVGAGKDVSIIAAGYTNTVIRCIGTIDPSTTLEGFSITQGDISENGGGGIHVSACSNIQIRNNSITQNYGRDNSGAGIYIENSSPSITNNTISGNRCQYVNTSASAILITGSSSAPYIYNNAIKNNMYTQYFT